MTTTFQTPHEHPRNRRAVHRGPELIYRMVSFEKLAFNALTAFKRASAVTRGRPVTNGEAMSAMILALQEHAPQLFALPTSTDATAAYEAGKAVRQDAARAF